MCWSSNTTIVHAHEQPSYDNMGMKRLLTCISDIRKLFDKMFIAAKPQIDEHASSPESMIVQEDDTLAIWCNVSGTPAPEVTWFRLLGQDDPPVGKDTPVGKHRVPLVPHW